MSSPCFRGLASWCGVLVVAWLSRTFPLVVCHVSLPPAVACVPSYPIALCSWGCTSTSYCLMIMRVCIRLHGTLYPMTDCVLYLGRLLCWRCGPRSADAPWGLTMFH